LNAYDILARKRAGLRLDEDAVRSLVAGAAGGAWSDAELAAFLMAAAIRGLDGEETQWLTRGMLESGEQWRLFDDLPELGDKHSTGGVGDKISLILSPLLAACGQPIVMLTGRALGHTGGTADKLETIPGLDLAIDRERCLRLLERTGMAIGIATDTIAPADRRLYELRDRTATVDSLPLITASILSKKLATGASAIVFDVKTGDGAFMRERRDAAALASLLVDTCSRLGRRASALITDMSQPLGCWVGHTAEIGETVDCLEGGGPEDVMELVLTLSEEVSRLTGSGVARVDLERAVDSGAARAKLDQWVEAQGGDPSSLPELGRRRAPVAIPITASRSGRLAAVATRRLGLLLGEAGGAARDGQPIDSEVALEYTARIGQPVRAGDELAQVYLRRRDDELCSRFTTCFAVADDGEAPGLIVDKVLPSTS
jgi:pyrimidine-nucleoside phosphorylase